MTPSIYVAIPLMALLTILQTAVLPHLTILGLAPQLPFLVALSWALVRGLEEGLGWAFIGGLFLDMFSITPIGVSSLAFMVGIIAVLWIERALPASRVILPVVLALLATFVSLLVLVVMLRFSGWPGSLQQITLLLPLTILHAVLILPVYWLVYRLDRRARPRRVEL